MQRSADGLVRSKRTSEHWRSCPDEVGSSDGHRYVQFNPAVAGQTVQTNQPNSPNSNGLKPPVWRQVLHVCLICCAVAILVMICLSAFPAIGRRPPMAPVLTGVYVQNVVSALKQHQETLGHYPTGSLSQISRALRGSNQSGLVFLNAPSQMIGPSGELLDAWRKPIMIVCTNSDALKVYSFGPNGKDDHGDLAGDDLVGR